MFEKHLSKSNASYGSGFTAGLTGLVLTMTVFTMTACSGGGSEDGQHEEVKLMLDFTPNPVHLGIYQGIHDEEYQSRGISVEPMAPTGSADVLRLLDAKQVDFVIMEANDLIAQTAEENMPYVGVYAVIQRPLSGLAMREEDNITRPKQLEGQTVGVVGNPNTEAQLEAMLQADGSSLEEVEQVTIGFGGPQALATKKVDAFSGFATDAAQAGVTGEYPTSFMYSYEWGVPEYPSLILVTRSDTIEENPELVENFVQATEAGYKTALTDVESSLEVLLDENPELDGGEVAEAELEAVLPAIHKEDLAIGEIDMDDMQAIQDWAAENELFSGMVELDDIIDDSFRAG